MVFGKLLAGTQVHGLVPVGGEVKHRGAIEFLWQQSHFPTIRGNFALHVL